MSDHVYKRHNKTLLLYHLVFPAKYRRKVITRAVEETLQDTCIGISQRYEIKFLEIGSDDDHAHFLIQSVPNLSVTRIVTILKSITTREIYKIHPEEPLAKLFIFFMCILYIVWHCWQYTIYMV